MSTINNYALLYFPPPWFRVPISVPLLKIFKQVLERICDSDPDSDISYIELHAKSLKNPMV